MNGIHEVVGSIPISSTRKKTSTQGPFPWVLFAFLGVSVPTTPNYMPENKFQHKSRRLFERWDSQAFADLHRKSFRNL